MTFNKSQQNFNVNCPSQQWDVASMPMVKHSLSNVRGKGINVLLLQTTLNYFFFD